MQSPPPYNGGQPKKSKTGLIIGLIIGGVVLCCVLPIGVLGGGGLYFFNANKGSIGCMASLPSMSSALDEYAAAHDGKFPNKETWQDDLRPYYKKLIASEGKDNPIPFIPAEGDWPCKESDTKSTGFAFNTEMSGKKKSEVPPTSVVIFEVTEVKKNNFKSYIAGDKKNSPTIVGKPRGWLYITANGELSGSAGGMKMRKGMKTGASAGADFKVNTESDK